MNDEISKEIYSFKILEVDENIYDCIDQETGETIHNLYGYDDWIKIVNNFFELNEDLLRRLSER
jgi:hypothetical protein